MLCLQWDHYVPVYIHSTPIFTNQYYKRIYTTFFIISFDTKIFINQEKNNLKRKSIFLNRSVAHYAF